jgi:hypothetical protein
MNCIQTQKLEIVLRVLWKDLQRVGWLFPHADSGKGDMIAAGRENSLSSIPTASDTDKQQA